MIYKTLLSVSIATLLSGIVFGKEPQPPQAPRPPRPPMMAAMEMDCDHPPMLEHLKDRLELTADQESAVFDAMRQHCETMKTASQKLMDTMKHVLTPEQQAQMEKMHRQHERHGERDQGEHRREHDGGDKK